MKPTRPLHDFGQSLWLDNITRTLLDDHGRLQAVVPADGGGAPAVLSLISRAGVDIEAMAAKRQHDGAQSFVKSWQQLLQRIAEKSDASKTPRAASIAAP